MFSTESVQIYCFIFFSFSLTTCCLILWLILFTLLYKCFICTFNFLPFLCLCHVLTKCWFYLQVCLEVFESNELYVPFLIECQSLQGERGESWGGEQQNNELCLVFCFCFCFVCFSCPVSMEDSRPPALRLVLSAGCQGVQIRK